MDTTAGICILIITIALLLLILAIRQRRRKQHLPRVHILFFFSGFPALIYQIVWQRALFAAYGVNIESVTIVVSAFMLGLGLGSLAGGVLSKSKRLPLILLFAVAELLISIFGLVSLKLFHRIATLTVGSSFFKTGVVSFFLIIVPTMLMGATLPLLVEYVVRRSRNVGSSVGSLYFVNTLGSGVACFACADVLMRVLGQSGSVRFAACINLLVALGGITFSLCLGQEKEVPCPIQSRNEDFISPDNPLLPFPLALLVVAFGGFAALSYEIIWYRLLAFASGSSARVFASLLGSYLLGLALGSRFVAKHSKSPSRKTRTNVRVLVGVIFGSAIVSFLVAPGFALVLKYVSPYNANGPAWLVLLLLVCVGALFFGASFPLIAHTSVNSKSSAGSAVSYLYAANIVGSAAGSLLTGFILMNYFSPFVISVMLLVGGISFSVIVLVTSGQPIAKLSLILGIGLALLAPFACRPVYNSIYDRLLFKDQYPKSHFDRVVENRNGVIGVTPAGTIFGDGAYDGRFNVDLLNDINGIVRPFAISAIDPAPRHVLMIGLGSGSWAQVVANNPEVGDLKVVEINPGYLKLIAQYPAVKSLLHNPKVRITIDDGRRWLLRNPDEKFDMIVMNTTFHWRDHVSNLLSLEFLQIVRGHLNRTGILFYNTTNSEDVMATGINVFPYAFRFVGCLVVSDAPIVFDRNRWKSVLLNYVIDGKPIVDATNPQQMTQLDSVLNIKDDPSGTMDFSMEYDGQLRKRLKGRLIITDDNMGLEWR